MNIRFESIDIESFRSIDKAKVIFSDQGTVIVKGINEYEDKATSNGSGKSSIFEAVIFAIFEETSSGEKDVANRIIGNGYKITLQFSIDGNKYVIIRSCENKKTTVTLYKNDIDISARNKTDTNKLIIEILGISKSIFLDSIFLSQNANTNLASLAPAARKERLEILTNTEQSIAQFKEKLKAKQAEYEALCVEAQLSINKLNGNKDTLLAQKSTFQAKILEIDKQIEERNKLGNIEEIDNQINNLHNEISVLNLSIQKDSETISQYEEEYKAREQAIQDLKDSGKLDIDTKAKLELDKSAKQDEWSKVDAAITKNKLQIHFHEQTVEKVNQEIIKIQNSDKCPTCGRKYDDANDEHIANTIKEKQDIIAQEYVGINAVNAEQAQLQVKKEAIEREETELKTHIEEVQKLIDNNNDKINIIEQEARDINESKNRVHKSIQTSQDNINLIHKNISELQAKKQQILEFKVGDKTEFENMVKSIDQDVTNIDSSIKSETEKFNTNNDYVSAVKHSIQLVTKEFRTYLLQNSLNYLNKLLTKYSAELFSNEYDLIQIKQDDAKLDIVLGNAPYESLSGGEKTRVNIALLLAQKSLANIIGNISCNMIILDEILGYCDSKAEENVVNLISQELESLETIYMISHKEIPIGYDSQLIVVKDKQGLSRIKVH